PAGAVAAPSVGLVRAATALLEQLLTIALAPERPAELQTAA
ncbi:MAG: hypothetical protein JWO60_2972, partial [Frankiales bacterium]|nr:hypothetical protein [Frankiales bacterium]